MRADPKKEKVIVVNPSTEERPAAPETSLPRQKEEAPLRAEWNRRRRSAADYVLTFLKWIVVAGVIGGAGGLIGSIFHLSVEWATTFRERWPWLLFFLPVGGVLIAVLYKSAKVEGQDTNTVIDSVWFGSRVKPMLLPVIFIATTVTHLFGGSAGREGAALQIGGSLGCSVGRGFKLSRRDLCLATLCGMSAVFSALFGTPVTAAVFALEVVSVGVFQYSGLIPCLTASVCAYGVTRLFRIPATAFAVSVPAVAPMTLLKVTGLAVCFAVMAILFCETLHFGHKYVPRLLTDSRIRAAAGGAILIYLTLIAGTRDYNGAGMEIIRRAIEEGQALPTAFLMKLLFTAVTICFGFKGGEVVPSFFVGATLGCVLAPLLGVDAGFGAALGLVGVFCGAVNCPISSIFLSIELFGAQGLVYFAVIAAVSYMLSGRSGIYSHQHLIYSKLRASIGGESESAAASAQSEPRTEGRP